MEKYLEIYGRSHSRANRLRPAEALGLEFICNSFITFFSLAVVFAIPSIRKMIDGDPVDMELVGGLVLAAGALLVSFFAFLRIVAECLNAKVLRRSSRAEIRERFQRVKKSRRYRVTATHVKSMRIGAVAFGVAAVVSSIGVFLDRV